MTWLVRIWFKGLEGNQELRLVDSLPEYLISVLEFQGWTYVAARGKALIEYHALVDRWEVVPV